MKLPPFKATKADALKIRDAYKNSDPSSSPFGTHDSSASDLRKHLKPRNRRKRAATGKASGGESHPQKVPRTSLLPDGLRFGKRTAHVNPEDEIKASSKDQNNQAAEMLRGWLADRGEPLDQGQQAASDLQDAELLNMMGIEESSTESPEQKVQTIKTAYVSAGSPPATPPAGANEQPATATNCEEEKEFFKPTKEEALKALREALQSIAPASRPIVQLTHTYEKNRDPPNHIAVLTLILPLTHPAVQSHSLVEVLPDNQHFKEYYQCMEALKGSQSWTSSLQHSKADAVVDALLQFSLADVIAWTASPDLQVIIEEEESTEDREDNEQSCSRDRLYNGEQPAALKALLDLSPGEIVDKYRCNIAQNHQTKLFGARLELFVEGHEQVYEVDQEHDTPKDAEEAVCKLAFDLNVRGFVEWVLEAITDNPSAAIELIGEE